MTPSLVLSVSCWALLLGQAPPTVHVPFLGPVKADGSLSAPTDAERVARLQQAVEKGQEQLKTIRARLDDPASEYNQAQTVFKSIDGKLTEARKKLQPLREAGKKEEVAKQEDEVGTLQRGWQRQRDRFDLALKERKALKDKADALQQKIQQDQQALDKLQESSTPAAAGAREAADAGTRESKELVKAREQARLKEQAAREAKDKARSLAERMEALRRQIDLEGRLLETARQKAENAQRSETELELEQTRRREANAPQEELRKRREWILASGERRAAAHAEIAEITDRLNELQADLTALQAEQIVAMRDADQKGREADAAGKTLADLQNPFTLHNLLQWLIDHGVKMLLILVGMLVLNRMVRLSSRRIVRVVARSNTRSHQGEDDRAETLVGVFRNLTSMLILVGGTLMLLDEVGVPVVPLMGGAAVFGLAVAFGAQNLIKDYFTGFMVLLEDQYGVNDHVKIGSVEGKVERITLRMTVLRDGDGAAHFIPHGAITMVSNLSHGYSKASLEIGVAYKEDTDRVMAVLKALAEGLREDSEYGPLILDGVEMQGVDRLTDSAVMVRFALKTRPAKQWSVRRELLRRIKKRFDELGIEIPYPHRTVYHRAETNGDVPPWVAPRREERAA